MDLEKLKQLLADVRQGTVGIDQAVEQLRHLPFEQLEFASIDHHRQIRCGFPEVIYCPGKTIDQIIDIFTVLAQKGNNILATRAERDVFDALRKTRRFPDVVYEEKAKAVVLRQKEVKLSAGFIAVITAGTADIPVAEEARVTAEVMGQQVKVFPDVGVAGLHRLLAHIGTLQQANVIIVVAGMEGALPSVVGGMVDSPVIAVPTSVGYGASFDGLAALLTMLNSCAAGVTVVNIDSGFSAGYTAAIINQKIEAGKCSR
ncbi:MAG: nickel pincer cofactor biosynthesis protein LarB [Planctomycetota bacterium]